MAILDAPAVQYRVAGEAIKVQVNINRPYLPKIAATIPDMVCIPYQGTSDPWRNK